MTTDIDVNIEPLPGYRLIEHIGAGGYGEVWRAEAPGGLTKAIKFVFGKHHEKRASNELRALDHVRGVRHPFLLSLERIEVVDGRLLVVTELADGSLKDRFDACRREGLRGIPRDELLGYLRDAADALDFMSESHALQHLDIKPENLLLLAGHVKVADFGLVKDVRQSQASLVGGMTPLYAAPEVFRGTPSRHSDQYSLAIVYQEMLTGTLPFAGGNAAELTLQHLNDEPDLSALSTADRYAVSRALAKDPQHRYATCREFVDALAQSGVDAMRRSATREPQRLAVSQPSAVCRIGHSREACRPTFSTTASRRPGTQRRSSCWSSCRRADCSIGRSAAGRLDARATARPVPTLVLGIGGTAARVLSHLRQLIHEQYGGAARAGRSVPACSTPTRERFRTPARRCDAGLTPDETLNLPLRRPQHYREQFAATLALAEPALAVQHSALAADRGAAAAGPAGAGRSRPAGGPAHSPRDVASDRAAVDWPRRAQAVGREFRSDALRVLRRGLDFRRHGRRHVARHRLRGPSDPRKARRGATPQLSA